jgi:hypothetical protein
MSITSTGRSDYEGKSPSPEAPDEFVPDTQVVKEFHITPMSLWRWSNDPTLGFPPAVTIRRRKFRSRRQLEAFKERMLRLAIEARSQQDTAA